MWQPLFVWFLVIISKINIFQEKEKKYFQQFSHFDCQYLYRYTNDGEIIAHSILGSVQDFVSEAIRRNEMKVYAICYIKK